MHILAPWCAAGRPSAVRHEAAFLPTHSCVRVRGEQMPFGKNKHLAPRAKKKAKVEAREEVLDAAKEIRAAKENAGQGAAAPPSAPAEGAAAPSPGGLKRQQAEDELIELAAESEVREEVAAEAEKQLALAQRLYDAKMRRLDASQAGKRHGNPHKELERIYGAEIELLRAQRACAEAQVQSERADGELLAQQIEVLRLEKAKLRRTVRKLGGACA